jgi:hypothetical protein
VFSDRIARLAVSESAGWNTTAGWMEQFERRGPIEMAGSQADGLIERLAGLADLPRLELPAWTGWQIESGAPRPKLVLDDSPSVSIEEEPVDRPGPRRGGRRKATPRVQLAGRIWFDYAGLAIAADDRTSPRVLLALAAVRAAQGR